MGTFVFIAWICAGITGAVVTCLGSLWLWVWCAAKSVRVDESRKACCGAVGRLSILCKLAYLFQVKVNDVERNRFKFFVGGEEGKSFAYWSREQASDGGGRSVLVISFCGGSVNMIGFPRTEFRRTILAAARKVAKESNANNSQEPKKGGNEEIDSIAIDQLFVLDPSGMSFFNYRQKELFDVINAAVDHYNGRVVMIGNCMGATGVLRSCHLLKENGVALAFNPEINPKADSRKVFRLGAWLQPAISRRMSGEISNSIQAAQSRGVRVLIFSSAWSPEQAQVSFIPDSIARTESLAVNDVVARVVKWKATNPPVALSLTVTDVHEHGMLAKHFKPKGVLVKIAEEVIR